MPARARHDDSGALIAAGWTSTKALIVPRSAGVLSTDGSFVYLLKLVEDHAEQTRQLIAFLNSL